MSLRAVIVSRVDCFKCRDIQQALESEKVPNEVILWHNGGPEFLAKHSHVPLYLPSTFLFDDDRVIFEADGLAQFMERWDNYLCGDLK